MTQIEIATVRGGRRLAQRALMIAWIALPPLLLAGCDQKTNAAPAPPPPAVGIVTVIPEPVRRLTELPGRTTAMLTADVRPQISGVILRRLVTEGSEVKEGQQLYEIDSRPYKAALDHAMAPRDQDQA